MLDFLHHLQVCGNAHPSRRRLVYMKSFQWRKAIPISRSVKMVHLDRMRRIESNRGCRLGNLPTLHVAVAALLTLGVAFPCAADNGLSLIGTGAESVAMGGADVAVARDTTALSTNPAGLSQVHGWAFDAFGAAAVATDVAHADQFDNDKFVSNRVIPLVGNGFSKEIDGKGITLGIGLFAQAGAGNIYNNLNTPFGGTDTLRAQFGVVKFTPGLAWKLSDRFAVGTTLNVYYASLTQRVFPNVSSSNPSNPAQSYFGTQIKGASSVQFGAKFGVLWEPTSSIHLGVTYTPRTNLPFNNGTLIVNLSAIGLGNVSYHNVQLHGFALPEEVAVGAAWQATPKLLVALDVQQANYSRAIRTQALSASDPDNSQAPPEINNKATLNWHNQTVLAAGVAYSYDDVNRLYGGVNYGRNPIPANNLNPLLAAIGEWHFTGGFAHQLSEHWNLSAALEYLLPNRVTYDNPQLPFGPDAQERISYVAVTLMLSRRW